MFGRHLRAGAKRLSVIARFERRVSSCANMGGLRSGVVCMSLLWLHSFARELIAEYFSVLCHGASPSPKLSSKTKQYELDLGITPPSVYCYLGRTLEAFGDFAVALRPESLPDGKMSPFDTGGILKNIRPVCTWETDKKREYIERCSWPTNMLGDVLRLYPGGEQASRLAYLESQRPSHAGPHALWPDRPEAEIWSHPDNQWRAWIWEGRWGARLPTATALVAWSCAPARYASVLAHADSVTDPVEQANVDRILGAYVSGGVAELLQRIRAEQLQ